ncbi:MAG: adenylate/guanylate cyclase domain-containing protein [Candidatus Hydrogenedentota bacterium]|nr:MAG: adenylate/guanylate cyclase domain-containing protein [Candidatus Hydrogenedentota bacterium]
MTKTATVTVLSTNFVGSMDLQEQADPEEWRRIMDGFFTVLSDGVHQFEGRGIQFTGDGIMALCGAAIAHEDHVRRACYAALKLRDNARHYAEEVQRTHELGLSVRLATTSAWTIR